MTIAPTLPGGPKQWRRHSGQIALSCAVNSNDQNLATSTAPSDRGDATNSRGLVKRLTTHMGAMAVPPLKTFGSE